MGALGAWVFSLGNRELLQFGHTMGGLECRSKDAPGFWFLDAPGFPPGRAQSQGTFGKEHQQNLGTVVGWDLSVNQTSG